MTVELHHGELMGMRAVNDDPLWGQMSTLGLESGLWEPVYDSHGDHCLSWGVFAIGRDEHEFFKEADGLYCGGCGTKTEFPKTWNGSDHDFWRFGLILNDGS